MALTLLQLVDQACYEMGVDAPATVISNTGKQVIQLLGLANRVGQNLVREHEWRRCVLQYSYQTTASLAKTGDTTINSAVVNNMNNTTSLAVGMVVSGTGIPSYATIVTIDSGTQITMDMAATATGTTTALTFATQDYALPSGFNREISSTNWDRSDHWMNLGPKSSQEWQWLQGGVIAAGPRFRYRIYQNKIRFFPAPTSVYNFAYEYVSDYWILASGGAAATKASFTVDTDTTVFPDELMVAGIKWQWFKAHGADFELAFKEYKELLSQCKAQDEDNPTLSLSPQVTPLLIGPWSVPDGNWSNQN